MAGINFTDMKYTAYNQVSKFKGRIISNIEICRIDKVDIVNKTVSAYFFDSGLLRRNVPYSYPFYNNGYGIIFAPSKGALAIAAWDSFKRLVILSFVAPSTVDSDGNNTCNIPQLGHTGLPDLLEGEILLEGIGKSFIKLDKLGGLLLSSSIFSHIKLNENGDYELDVENAIININGTAEENYLEDYIVSTKIVKGKHNYSSVQYPSSSLELVYRVSILENDKENGFFGIGSDGNVYLSGDVIKGGEVKNGTAKRARHRAGEGTDNSRSKRRHGRKKATT